MKRFLKHFMILLFLVPLVLILLFITRCAATAELVDQYGVLTKSTVTEADGTIYCERFEYAFGYTDVTVEYYENDVLVRTETRKIEENDPLLHDSLEVLPHPTATAASTKCEEDTLYYFDAGGNAEGRSELVYNRWDRLSEQRDYDAEGTLLRTTKREFVSHTDYISDLSAE